MAIKYAPGKKTAAAKTRILVAIIAGVVAFFVAGNALAWYVAPLIGWDVAILVYVGWIWLTLSHLEDADTAEFALREDPSRSVTDVVLLVASVASLAAVGMVLAGAGQGGSAKTLLQVGFGVCSVLLGWVLVHTIFMLRYAENYYRDGAGGVEFDGAANRPTFKDFAYLAFTMGMTFQVSDTGFQSTGFRSLALKHALLSYLFGTIIVATTINLVAGLMG